MAQQKSKKGKGSYLSYKNENRAEKNKIKKLERHCRKFPKDEIGKKNLERIKKDGYKCRNTPLAPGSNKQYFYLKVTPVERIKTPGEQLAEVLGIPMPKVIRAKRNKPVIKHRKPKRNVKKS